MVPSDKEREVPGCWDVCGMYICGIVRGAYDLAISSIGRKPGSCHSDGERRMRFDGAFGGLLRPAPCRRFCRRRSPIRFSGRLSPAGSIYLIPDPFVFFCWVFFELVIDALMAVGLAGAFVGREQVFMRATRHSLPGFLSFSSGRNTAHSRGAVALGPRRLRRCSVFRALFLLLWLWL